MNIAQKVIREQVKQENLRIFGALVLRIRSILKKNLKLKEEVEFKVEISGQNKAYRKTLKTVENTTAGNHTQTMKLMQDNI